MSKGAEGSKNGGPSKKELKKLAKKAQKDAAKVDAKQASGAADAANKENGSAAASVAATNTPAPPSPVYRLANIPSSLAVAANDPCVIKACAGSILFSKPLLPGGNASTCSSLPFVRGPALLYGNAPPVVAFGGNGILKALSGKSVSPITDDWLEFERTELRPALTSGNAKKIDAALDKINAALEMHGGVSVVGTEPLKSVADVAITVTLLLSSATTSSLPPLIRTYVQITQNSHAYTQTKSLLKSLLPPSTSYDPANPSLIQAASAIFASAIFSAFPAAQSLTGQVDIKAFKCKDIKHGDYQCNVAMPLFQKLKAANALPGGVASPQQVAQAIIDNVPKDNPVLCDLTVNGPGFVMSRIKEEFLERGVNEIVRRGAPPKPKCADNDDDGSNSTVVVDFSSPNIAKEMHVGHLRSTIIGEAVCRILEYTGKSVKRVNHVGDWGTQFGMLIQYLKEEYPDFHQDVPNITDLTAFYKNAKSRFDESAEFKKISQLNVVELQAGDEECRKIWQVLCDVSRKEFEKVYDRLDITVEECGESFYNDKIPPVIEEFMSRGMISVEEGGAKCVFVPNFKIPLMLQKSDGGYGYDSTDMAAIKYRLHDLKARQIVYITDFTQGDHFQMVFAAAKKIGWVDDDSHRLDHIGFGTVQGEDGKRFKTRSGDTVRLVDLLDEAVSRMEASLRERNADADGKGGNVSEDEIHKTACAMGYGAVKYFDLRRNPTSNYIFSYDRMLDTKGNTAIYLLYAHARLESIISKGKADFGVDVDALIADGKSKIVLSHKSERNLGLHLEFFADTIEETLRDLYPYHICDFVYALSIAASEFVTQCKVLGSPEMESRLLLCRATAITMRQCFDLLGIRHVMRI
jgi:arginyl-tRNA synthetase